LFQRPMRQPLLPLPATFPRVDIVPVYGGADVAMARAILSSGAAGVVIDGLGRGQVPPEWVAPLREAMHSGMVVAVCSSTLHGATAESYQYPGALHDLVAAGAIPVSHLSARKARIRLSLCMAATMPDTTAFRDALQGTMNTF